MVKYQWKGMRPYNGCARSNNDAQDLLTESFMVEPLFSRVIITKLAGLLHLYLVMLLKHW